jgi:hypothetical protein
MANLTSSTYWVIDFAAIGLSGLLAALLTAIVAIECSAFFLGRRR